MTLMDAKLARAHLEVSGSVRVDCVTGSWNISAVRAGDWKGSPYLSHYVVMLFLSRLWRWVRRDHRWLVVVVPVGVSDRDGEVRAEAQSRAEAIEQAVEVACALLRALGQ